MWLKSCVRRRKLRIPMTIPRASGVSIFVSVAIRHPNPFGSPMRPSVLSILLLLPWLPLAAQQMPPLGIIDFYGLRTLPESTVRRTLGIREGDPVPDSAGPATRRLRALPGVADARLNLVCC